MPLKKKEKMERIQFKAGTVVAGKILWGHGPGIREKKQGLWAKPTANFFDHALFARRKHPILAQRLATYTRKAVKMKEQK